MEKSALWSLRLGFGTSQAEAIERLGLREFLDRSFSVAAAATPPPALENAPKTLADYEALKRRIKTADAAARRAFNLQEREEMLGFKGWWIDRMAHDPFPLREKMTVFWHNHFVAGFMKVKLAHWIYRHNCVLRDHAFGNLRTLVKKAVATNAMIRYLDNGNNIAGKPNENLSRELLELFTLGIGHYTEQDVKNGAKGLAGLKPGPEDGAYVPRFENQESFTYLGVTGNLRLDGMVDAIFRHPQAPYLVTRKLLKWFLYEVPDEKLVRHYGDFLKKQDYEIRPFLTKVFTEEYEKESAGANIKDPTVFLLQLAGGLHIAKNSGRAMAPLLKQLGMDLYGQPNVKGWDGGTAWLTMQTYQARQAITDRMCRGRFPKAGAEDDGSGVSVDFDPYGSNTTIIKELAGRMLYRLTPEMQEDFERMLKYDFDPRGEGAQQAVVRLFNAMAKRPEFQLI